MKLIKSLSAAYEKNKIRKGFYFIVGCDEVGRGCLAGPVVAAAVVLDLHHLENLERLGINDSKRLSAKQREMFDGVIKRHSVAWAVGLVDEKMIDEINIHHASLLAMRRAVENLLNITPKVNTDNSFLALDGKFLILEFDMKQEAVIKGDEKILSVAAASIIAKVYRDKLMGELHGKHPHYNFIKHKGYATQEHRDAIKKFGLLPAHRLSFCKKYADAT